MLTPYDIKPRVAPVIHPLYSVRPIITLASAATALVVFAFIYALLVMLP